jgi:hypothetical protein
VKVVQEKKGGEGKERGGVSVDSGKQNAEGSAEIVRTAVPQSIAESREAHRRARMRKEGELVD